MSAPGLQGLRPWVIQRVTAVYLALFTIYFALALLVNHPFNENNWQQWVAWPVNNIALMLFIVALLWHVWIGIRDVILDYLPNVVARLLALTLVAAVLLGSGFWSLKALVMVLVK